MFGFDSTNFDERLDACETLADITGCGNGTAAVCETVVRAGIVPLIIHCLDRVRPHSKQTHGSPPLPPRRHRFRRTTPVR
jgi:hypothetical protein